MARFTLLLTTNFNRSLKLINLRVLVRFMGWTKSASEWCLHHRQKEAGIKIISQYHMSLFHYLLPLIAVSLESSKCSSNRAEVEYCPWRRKQRLHILPHGAVLMALPVYVWVSITMMTQYGGWSALGIEPCVFCKQDDYPEMTCYSSM